MHKERITRSMYMAQAALEYLIAILMSGSFFAALTKQLGISDSLTGILSSIISLGCLFQLLSLSFRRARIKPFIIAMSIANQVLFMLLYIIPLTDFSATVKTTLFVICILSAYLIYNLAHPKKIDWTMSLIQDHERGRFCANKEIISLIVGMIFSYTMGTIIDHHTESGSTQAALMIVAGVVLVLIVLHTLSMFLIVELPHEKPEAKNLKQCFIDVFQNRKVMLVTVVIILYNIATYAATPFFGTYLIGELDFSLQFVSILAMVGSIVRIFVSKFWGRYADKNSFSVMVEKCFLILGMGLLATVFATPKTGVFMFVIYYICQGIAMGGINSSLVNLVFDYSEPDKRADSYAVCSAFSGVCGFVSTLVMSALVSHIQASGNQFLGMPVYAQQVASCISIVFLGAAILFNRWKIMDKK